MFKIGDYVRFVFIFDPALEDAVFKIKGVVKAVNKKSHKTVYYYYFEDNPWKIESSTGSNLEPFIKPKQS